MNKFFPVLSRDKVIFFENFHHCFFEILATPISNDRKIPIKVRKLFFESKGRRLQFTT